VVLGFWVIGDSTSHVLRVTSYVSNVER